MDWNGRILHVVEEERVMKVIFLDVDGVLNNVESITKGVHLLPEKVLLINDICEATSADIVISSAWRHQFTQRVMIALLRVAGLHRGEVVGMTGNDPDGFRGKEIEAWLCVHYEHKVEKYVILDDSSDMLEKQKPYFVRTDGCIGLMPEQVDEAIEILGGEDGKAA